MDLHNSTDESIQNILETRGLKRFSELETISSGGYGIVFRGKHALDEQTYAIKMIPIQLPIYGEYTQSVSECSYMPFIKSKLREVRYLAKLTHPHIVRYHTSWMDICNTREELDRLLEVTGCDKGCEWSFECLLDSGDDTSNQTKISPSTPYQIQHNPKLLLYIQMEEMEYTLTDWIESEKPLLAVQYQVLIGLLDGIHYLHQSSPPIIHCDIKPKNILLCRNGTGWVAKLADFGLVSILHGPWRPDTDEGTYLYKAPELGNDDPLMSLTPAVDIYSLGVLLYECSLQATTRMECVQRLQQLKLGQLEKLKLSPILVKMLDKNPLNRPTILQVKHYIEEMKQE